MESSGSVYAVRREDMDAKTGEFHPIDEVFRSIEEVQCNHQRRGEAENLEKRARNPEAVPESDAASPHESEPASNSGVNRREDDEESRRQREEMLKSFRSAAKILAEVGSRMSEEISRFESDMLKVDVQKVEDDSKESTNDKTFLGDGQAGAPPKKSSLGKMLRAKRMVAVLRGKAKAARDAVKIAHRKTIARNFAFAARTRARNRKVTDLDTAITGKVSIDLRNAASPRSPQRRKKVTRLKSTSLRVVGDMMQYSKNKERDETEVLAHFHNEKGLSCLERMIINPYNPWHTAWDFLICCMLLAVVWTLPLSLAFDEAAAILLPWDIIVDVFFWCDFVKHFFTGYIKHDETIEMSPPKVAKHYLKTWAGIDFISCIPFSDIISAFTAERSAATIAKSARSVKMLRLIRVAKLLRKCEIPRVLFPCACKLPSHRLLTRRVGPAR